MEGVINTYKRNIEIGISSDFCLLHTEMMWHGCSSTLSVTVAYVLQMLHELKSKAAGSKI